MNVFRRRYYDQRQAPRVINPYGHTDDAVRIAWLTDSHTVSQVTYERDAALREAVAQINAYNPLAVVHSGDVGGGQNADGVVHLRKANGILRDLDRPFYWAPGNHDIFGECTNNVEEVERVELLGKFPFYRTAQLTSGDGTLKARLLVLDGNYYGDPELNGVPSACLASGDYYGMPWPYFPEGQVPPRALTATQITWVEQTLAADTTSEAVLVFVHYPPAGGQMTDFPALASALVADGRPTRAFCGHVHAHGLTTVTNGVTALKGAAFRECGAWYEVEVRDGAGGIEWAVTVRNFDPVGLDGNDTSFWTFSADFVLP